MDIKVKSMIKLIEEDADSFRKRAEMYYRKRPELMKLVEEFYRAYRALAERYDHATGALRQAHCTMAEAFPDQVPLIFMDESPDSSTDAAEPPPQEMLPHDGALDHKDLQKDVVDMSSRSTAFNKNGAFPKENDPASSKSVSWKSTTGEEFSNGWARNGLVYQNVDGKGLGDKATEECQKLKNQILRETERANEAEAEVSNLKDTVSKLESEKEALSVQYRLSLEKISSLESDISSIKEDLKKLDDETLAEKSESKSLEDGYHLLKKENLSLQSELCLLKETTKKQQEDLDMKKGELEKLNVSLTEERKRFMQAEMARLSLEQLHSQSQEEVRGLSLENQNLVAKLMNMEMSKVSLEEEIQRLKEETGILNEQTGTSALMIKNLQVEISLLEKSKRRLEDEVVRYVEEKRSLQQEVLSIKADKRELEQRHQDLTEQIGAVNLNVETLHTMVKELRDGNVELKDLCKKHDDERNLHLESLKFLEKITEKNAVVEKSLSTANAELEELREKVKRLEEACETLNGKIFMHISEKTVLLSQIEAAAQQMEKLLEKNTLLENSLSDVNVELEGLGGKLNILEESCRTLRDQNSTLLAEKASLVTQVEIINHSLINLESRHAELEGKSSSLEADRDQILHQVQKLQHSLRTQKEEYEVLNQSNRNRVDDLEREIHVLQEKGRQSEEELDMEHNKIINAQIEILVLQRVLHDMKETNTLMSDKCRKYLETLRCQEELISELKQEILSQTASKTRLSQYNEKLVEGVHQVTRMLKVGQECHSADDTQFKLILLEIENLKTLVLDVQDDNEHLALEKSVILTLLEQYGMNLAELQSKNNAMELELKTSLKEILVLQSEIHQLLDLNEQLRHDVQASSQREQVLRAETESQRKTLSDVRESHFSLQGDIITLIKENQSCSKKINILSEENDMLEENNNALVAEILNLDHLSLVFRSYNAERALEMQVLSDNMDHLRGVNSGLEEEIRLLQEKLGAIEVENMNLKESCSHLEEYGRRLVLLEDELKIASCACQELDLQLETGKKLLKERDMELLQVNQNFQAAQDKNTELGEKIEGLVMDVDKVTAAREELEKKNFTLSKYNIQKENEITDLNHINDTLSRQLYKSSEEVEKLKTREKHLTLELAERIQEVKSCEAEIGSLLNDILIATTTAAILEEKMSELLLTCESLEICSMVQKEMFYEEISVRNVYEDELKDKIDELNGENSGLKEELGVYLPHILSLKEIINSLEQRIFLLANHQSLSNQEKQDGSQSFPPEKSNEEGTEDHHALSSMGILELQKLHAKVNALEQAVIDIPFHLDHTRNVSIIQATGRESEGLKLKGSLNKEEMPTGKAIMLHLKRKEEMWNLKEGKPEQMIKDIQLDHVLSPSQCDNRASSHASSVFGSDKTKDQMMELWEAVDYNKLEKPSPMTSERDLEFHQIEALEEEKSVCTPKTAYVKELSIDKLELTRKAESNREWSGSICERLSSDAQRLSALQKSTQELIRNMEVSELSIAPTSFEFKQVRAQLKEAEAAILQLTDTNNKLMRTAEKLSASSDDEMGNASGRKISERALRGSEKTGTLEFELQKIEYIWLKLKEEHDHKKARAADKRTRVLLKDYFHGRRNKPKQKKVQCCACIRPRTKDE